MAGDVRPTLRCITEDLAPALPRDIAAEVRIARKSIAGDPTHVLPFRLSDLEHPVLQRACELADDERQRPIESISDRRVWRVKTGPHRGAMWKDDDGQWWLLAAGRRKDDGPGDFYVDIAAFGDDSSPLGPDALDYQYLKLERAMDADLQHDAEAQEQILDALLTAAADRGTPATVYVWGAKVSIRISADNDGGSEGELTVEIEMVTFEEQDRLPADLLGLVPFFGSLDFWDVLPPLGPSQQPIWWTLVPDGLIHWLSVAVELDELLHAAWPQAPESAAPDHPENFSHYVPRQVVTLAYVEGVRLRGLCGYEFTPHRDPDLLPTCQGCQEGLEVLRRIGRAR